MTCPFSSLRSAVPGVYFRQQNSDDSKSLIDSFFCSVDHALNLPLGLTCGLRQPQCHHCLFFGGNKHPTETGVLGLSSRNWGSSIGSHIFVARQVEEQEDEGTEIYSISQATTCSFGDGDKHIGSLLEPCYDCGSGKALHDSARTVTDFKTMSR